MLRVEQESRTEEEQSAVGSLAEGPKACMRLDNKHKFNYGKSSYMNCSSETLSESTTDYSPTNEMERRRRSLKTSSSSTPCPGEKRMRSINRIVIYMAICYLTSINVGFCEAMGGGSGAGSGESGGGRSKFGLYIVRSPESTIAPIGDEVVFECGLSVHPDRIVWRFLPQNASKEDRDNFRIIETNSPDYNISLTERSSNLGIIVNARTVGEYQCLAWYGGVSALASVAAQLILASISLPGGVGSEANRVNLFRVATGNTAIINCGEINSNPPAVWKYFKNNVLIHPDEEAAGNGILVINRIGEGDAGIYSCAAINSITSMTVNMPTKTELIVAATPRGAPHFLTQPPPVVKTRLGKKAMLMCPGVGNPVPKIIWSRDKGSISEERMTISNYGLHIAKVEVGDQGFYHCSVDNGIAPQLRHSVELRLLEPPQIIKGPVSTLTNESGVLMMDCIAIGNPAPKISWYINGENVEWDPKIRIYGPTIYIETVEKTHAGMIQCFAKNEAGEVNEANMLQVNPKQVYSAGAEPLGNFPDSRKSDLDHEGKKKHKHRKFSETIMIPPSKPSVTRLSDESVMVRWSVASDDGLPIQFFKVQYRMIGSANGTTPRGQWMTSSEDIPPHVRSYEVKGLKPDHLYRFRIAAVYSNNDNKLGTISGKFHLQRASQLSPAKSHLVVPILQRVQGVSENEIRFEWSLSSNNIGSTAIEGFYAYFRPASTAGEYSKATIDGMDTRDFTLNHLEPGTSYEFKLQSFTASAASDFSAILTGKTLSPPVQRPPVESTIIEDTKPKTHPNYIVIGAVTVLGVIVALIIGFCVCKKCRQARDDGTESKAHPTDIPITDNNGFAGITNSLHKNNHNRSINITSNPLDSDKNRNAVMELRFLPNANNTTAHPVGLVPPHVPNNNLAHPGQGNHVLYSNNNNNNNHNNHVHNNHLHFVDGLPRRTLERGLPRNALGGSGNSGGSSIGVPTMNIGIPLNLGPRRNSGSNNIPVPSSPRMIRNGISAELLHQHHRSPLPKRAAIIGTTVPSNNLKRNIIRNNEPITSGSIEV